MKSSTFSLSESMECSHRIGFESHCDVLTCATTAKAGLNSLGVAQVQTLCGLVDIEDSSLEHDSCYTFFGYNCQCSIYRLVEFVVLVKIKLFTWTKAGIETDISV